MQLRGWGLTQASRIVIILLVVQHIGLGQVLAFAPAPTTGHTLARPTQATTALDTVVLLASLVDASYRSSAALWEYGSPAIPPDPAPLPRRLPRAPPAA
ncbi:MAG TPA: hypothetical protein VIE44_03170 [Methylomirabilota bacterium]|jgi:hypothetical protein